MRNSCSKKRRVLSLALIFAFLIEAAIPAVATSGKKYFKEGIQFAENKQWDKAAERLALALAEEPSNSEYQLHLQRALMPPSCSLSAPTAWPHKRTITLLTMHIGRPAR